MPSIPYTFLNFQMKKLKRFSDSSKRSLQAGRHPVDVFWVHFWSAAKARQGYPQKMVCEVSSWQKISRTHRIEKSDKITQMTQQIGKPLLPLCPGSWLEKALTLAASSPGRSLHHVADNAAVPPNALSYPCCAPASSPRGSCTLATWSHL